MIVKSSNPHRAPNTAQPARDWTADALCRGINAPEVFFPKGAGASDPQHIGRVKALCNPCPVRMTCALTALRNRCDWGIWGALDENQRRRILRHQPGDLKAAVRAEWNRSSTNPYFEAYAKRTEQQENGHVRWLVRSTSVTVLGRNYTPAQLGLILARGRDPHGTTKAICGRPSCVAPEHLADDIVRWERSRNAA
ncbi:WhiB family transcriptional regulator [Streptomyces sp. NPDC048507]|uniref:WhiB family transcriptional regulator n=1 Tax=Streptomyces sp. NPDC048507 TaxID=3365560 RepID=UPI0037227488